MDYSGYCFQAETYACDCVCVCWWGIFVCVKGSEDAQGGRLSQIEQELYEVEVRAANVVRCLCMLHIYFLLDFQCFECFDSVGLFTNNGNVSKTKHYSIWVIKLAENCFRGYVFVYVFFFSLQFFCYIYISQGSVAAQLRCGAIFNNHVIANFPQSVTVKEFLEWLIYGKDINKSLVCVMCVIWITRQVKSWQEKRGTLFLRKKTSPFLYLFHIYFLLDFQIFWVLWFCWFGAGRTSGLTVEVLAQ